jgi:hypothetical protein
MARAASRLPNSDGPPSHSINPGPNALLTAEMIAAPSIGPAVLSSMTWTSGCA